MTNPLFPSYITAPWKKKYVTQKKESHDCTFCAIVNRVGGLDRWEISRSNEVVVSLNKYPYNPGHLLIFPEVHYEKFENLPRELVLQLSLLIQRSIWILKKTHNPLGFNVGLNQGNVSGASISHLHWHIVPRYAADLNFMEILGTRVLVETLDETCEKLKVYRASFQGENTSEIKIV